MPAMPVRRRTLAALALAALAAAGCGGSAAGGDDRLEVVATTTIMGDLARQVAGEAADVTQVLAPNSDAHDYEPRPQDVVATSHAAVVLASGDGLDAWITEVVEQSGTDAELLDVSERLAVRRPGEEGERYDPHWWHDPRNTERAVAEIRDALSRAAPDARATFARNADAYLARVRALDRGIAACFAQIPAAQRKLVTDHDAFGYFAARYDLRVVGAVIPSQTTQAQASAGDVAALARTIRAEGVKAIFPEASVNARLARAIARQTGARADLELYGDTLGEKGSPGATYLGMEAANADAMVRGFTGGARSCEVPGD